MRVDSGVSAGVEISGLYDPMIAKLIVHDVDREAARRRMLRALAEFEIGGVKSLARVSPGVAQPSVLSSPVRRATASSSRELIAEQAAQLSGSRRASAAALRAPGRSSGATIAEVDGRRVEVKVLVPEAPATARSRGNVASGRASAAAGGSGAVVSPMQGTVLDVKVSGRRRRRSAT